VSRLRQILNDNYAAHYARVNAITEPAKLPSHRLRTYDLMYGEFVKGLPHGSKVLDLGCGTGQLLYWLNGYSNVNAVGVDSSQGQVEAAKKALPNVQVSCEDGLEFLRKNKASFAGVFCFDVLEHIPGEDLCLEWLEAAQDALIPEGFLVCRAPNAASLIACHTRYMDLTHERLFTSASLLQLLEAAGLADCRLIPAREASLLRKFRLFVEHILHRAVFLVCGRTSERVFSRNVSAVGFKQT
jgi:SAM-dependent methyltransferase